jgi:hypothetical protein
MTPTTTTTTTFFNLLYYRIMGHNIFFGIGEVDIWVIAR